MGGVWAAGRLLQLAVLAGCISAVCGEVDDARSREVAVQDRDAETASTVPVVTKSVGMVFAFMGALAGTPWGGVVAAVVGWIGTLVSHVNPKQEYQDLMGDILHATEMAVVRRALEDSRTSLLKVSKEIAGPTDPTLTTLKQRLEAFEKDPEDVEKRDDAETKLDGVLDFLEFYHTRKEVGVAFKDWSGDRIYTVLPAYVQAMGTKLEAWMTKILLQLEVQDGEEFTCKRCRSSWLETEEIPSYNLVLSDFRSEVEQGYDTLVDRAVTHTWRIHFPLLYFKGRTFTIAPGRPWGERNAICGNIFNNMGYTMRIYNQVVDKPNGRHNTQEVFRTQNILKKKKREAWERCMELLAGPPVNRRYAQWRHEVSLHYAARVTLPMQKWRKVALDESVQPAALKYTESFRIVNGGLCFGQWWNDKYQWLAGNQHCHPTSTHQHWSVERIASTNLYLVRGARAGMCVQHPQGLPLTVTVMRPCRSWEPKQQFTLEEVKQGEHVGKLRFTWKDQQANKVHLVPGLELVNLRVV